jgi:hypothetical protein
MSEHVKHGTGVIASAFGFVGSIATADHVASIVCATLGSIAATLTICSWVKHWLQGKD